MSRGWITYTDLLGTDLDISNVADMVDAITVEEENKARAYKAANRK